MGTGESVRNPEGGICSAFKRSRGRGRPGGKPRAGPWVRGTGDQRQANDRLPRRRHLGSCGRRFPFSERCSEVTEGQGKKLPKNASSPIGSTTIPSTCLEYSAGGCQVPTGGMERNLVVGYPRRLMEGSPENILGRRFGKEHSMVAVTSEERTVCQGKEAHWWCKWKVPTDLSLFRDRPGVRHLPNPEYQDQGQGLMFLTGDWKGLPICPGLDGTQW